MCIPKFEQCIALQRSCVRDGEKFCNIFLLLGSNSTATYTDGSLCIRIDNLLLSTISQLNILMLI